MIRIGCWDLRVFVGGGGNFFLGKRNEPIAVIFFFLGTILMEAKVQ